MVQAVIKTSLIQYVVVLQPILMGEHTNIYLILRFLFFLVSFS